MTHELSLCGVCTVCTALHCTGLERTLFGQRVNQQRWRCWNFILLACEVNYADSFQGWWLSLSLLRCEISKKIMCWVGWWSHKPKSSEASTIFQAVFQGGYSLMAKRAALVKSVYPPVWVSQNRGQFLSSVCNGSQSIWAAQKYHSPRGGPRPKRGSFAEPIKSISFWYLKATLPMKLGQGGTRVQRACEGIQCLV